MKNKRIGYYIITTIIILIAASSCASIRLNPLDNSEKVTVTFDKIIK